MMKVLFLGTSEFGLPILEALNEAKYELVGVVTQPDRPVGRHQELQPSPIKVWAQAHGLKVFQPAALKNVPVADVYIVASYGLLIPKTILELPAHGALNTHPSLLPKYRGPSPIHAAMLNGDGETGVTIIKLDEKMDHGPIVARETLKISNPKITYRELHDSLAKLGADLLVRILPRYLSNTIELEAQDEGEATYTQMIKKADGRIDWRQEADAIERKIRIYRDWPVAWSTLDGVNLKIYEANVLAACVKDGQPGQILKIGATIDVKCGIGDDCRFGILQIQNLQLAGGKPLSAVDFSNGRVGLVGKVLI